MPRNICVVTATRAEYGLLKCLIEDINSDSDLNLQLIVTGSHLSPEFGYTITQIEADGFTANKKIEILLSSDTAVGISKSMGLMQISIAEAYDELKPDIIVVLGDRYELVPIVSAANIAKIPVAHLNGGELTEGSQDELFRHAITKLSQIHFTAIEEYANRIINMGEDPARVFNVGEAGLDNIRRMSLLNKDDFEAAIDRTLKEKNLLITYHSETCNTNDENQQALGALLNCLEKLTDTLLIFTKSNADSGGRTLNKMIEAFSLKNPLNSVVFESLGQLRYLSALQYVDAVVGNSSSGIVEAPSFKISTINIGDRQKSRVRASSVIDVDSSEKAISAALTTVFSQSHKNALKNTINPYDKGGASTKIKDTLKKIDLTKLNVKRFYEKNVK